jgi:hypothetical protein
MSTRAATPVVSHALSTRDVGNIVFIICTPPEVNRMYLCVSAE